MVSTSATDALIKSLFHDLDPETVTNVLSWLTARKITVNSTPCVQLGKAVSEFGELADAIIKGDKDEIKDAIGDIIVCLIAAYFTQRTQAPNEDLAPKEYCSYEGPNPLHRALHNLSEALLITSNCLLNSVLNTFMDAKHINCIVFILSDVAKNYDLSVTECLESAYNVIKDRKGYMNENGVFIKEVDV